MGIALENLLHAVYRAQQGRARETLVLLSTPLKAELFMLVALAPLLYIDLRAAASELLLDTDASDDFGAGVCATVKKPFVKELLRPTVAYR